MQIDLLLTQRLFTYCTAHGRFQAPKQKRPASLLHTEETPGSPPSVFSCYLHFCREGEVESCVSARGSDCAQSQAEYAVSNTQSGSLRTLCVGSYRGSAMLHVMV